jgi:hypothetical protein
MKRVVTIVGLALVFTASMGATAADDPALAAARRCTQISDNLLRLTCFDKALAAGVGGAAAAPVAAPASPAPALAASAEAPATFGEENVRKSIVERDKAEVRKLSAMVTAVKSVRQDVYRVSLDNGQVWQQTEMSSMFTVAVGDSVEISKGRFGGYRMSRTSGGGSGWVSVVRAK